MTYALKRGRIVVFSSGERCDYAMHGTYVALCDVTEAEMQDALECVKQKAAYKDRKRSQDERLALFEPELIKRGWILAVDMQEINIGEYGKLCLQSL
jgi:hypothetical protein